MQSNLFIVGSGIRMAPVDCPLSVFDPEYDDFRCKDGRLCIPEISFSARGESCPNAMPMGRRCPNENCDAMLIKLPTGEQVCPECAVWGDAFVIEV